jgi:transcriptional regulator with XRE-family HTH domain
MTEKKKRAARRHKPIGFQREDGGPTRMMLPGLGRRVRQRREALGLSLRGLDARTENLGHRIPYSNLCNIEREVHHRGGLGARTLQTLATALNVSADWLLMLTDDPVPPHRRGRT